MALVETSLVEGVKTVTLADVDNRNALSARLTVELVDALDAADADPEVRVVVLTNRGRVFCAGADLSERSSDDAPSRVVSPLELFGRFRNSPKPYVGRIAGHCVAGGMGLAAAMDISVATDEAKFGFTEVRIGVAPAMISVICLPKMRPADANEVFLRGSRFPAARAVELGLINRAVPTAPSNGLPASRLNSSPATRPPRAWPPSSRNVRHRGCRDPGGSSALLTHPAPPIG